MKTPIHILLRAVCVYAAFLLTLAPCSAAETTAGSGPVADGSRPAPGFGWAPGDVRAGEVRAQPHSWGVPPVPWEAAILLWSPPADPEVIAWALVGSPVPVASSVNIIYDFVGPEFELPAGRGWGVYHVLDPHRVRYVFAAPIYRDRRRPHGDWIPLGDVSPYLRLPAVF